MQPTLPRALEDATSLDDVLRVLLDLLAANKAKPQEIYYVAGAITADGDHKIEDNARRLIQYRQHVATLHESTAFVFTSPDIFTQPVYANLKIFNMAPKEREQAFQDFYDRVIESKHLDGIYFTPGWERSRGAKREHQTAQQVGVQITFL